MQFETPEPSINDALLFLHQLGTQFSAEGNIDSERDALSTIQRRLLNNEMSPKVAIQEAKAIESGRIER